MNERHFLHAEGRDIVNTCGEKVMLCGTNLGGWLLREGWMDGNGAYERPVTVRGESRGMLDLGEGVRWNRLYVSGMHGTFRVEAGVTPDVMDVIGEGCTENVQHSRACCGRPVPYILGGNPYNEECFFDGKCIHLNEQRTRYVRFTGNGTVCAVGYYGDADEFTVHAALRRRFGDARARQLLNVYQDAYITERDLDFIQSLELNLVRVPIYWEQLMDTSGQIRPDAWCRTDWLVRQCDARGIYVILDLHGLPGGQSGGILAGGRRDMNEFWASSDYQFMTLEMLTAMAVHYAHEPCVAAYDLMNEPLPILLDDARRLYKSEGKFAFPEEIGERIAAMFGRMIEAVRGADARHMISVSMFVDNRILKAPATYGWENVLYQTHTYGYGDWRSESEMMRAVQTALKEHCTLAQLWNVPVLAGEFNFWESQKVLTHWLNGLNALGISWCGWTYKNTDPEKRDNWGIYYGFDGETPDCERDEYDDIARKYAHFTSENYKMNELLAHTFSQAAHRARKGQ